MDISISDDFWTTWSAFFEDPDEARVTNRLVEANNTTIESGCAACGAIHRNSLFENAFYFVHESWCRPEWRHSDATLTV